MDRDTRIVFIHRGSNWYLPYVVHQATHASPGAEVVVLGDRPGCGCCSAVPLAELSGDEISCFDRVYTHMSSNSSEFESFCWHRWFLLRNYMQRHGVRSVLHLDSDVLLYSSLQEIAEAYRDVRWECALAIPGHNDAASGHVSYWTLEMLDLFCRFIIESFEEERYLARYREKWRRHAAHALPGGVCDMTTLTLFTERHAERVFNLLKRHNSSVFDNVMSSGSNYAPDEYLTERGLKRVTFLEGRPFLTSAEPVPQRVAVHALHFQGAAKRLIRRFYTGAPFPGKWRSDVKFTFHSLKLQARATIAG